MHVIRRKKTLCQWKWAFACVSDHFMRGTYRPPFHTRSWGVRLELLVSDVLSCNSHTAASRNWFDSGVCLSWPGPVFCGCGLRVERRGQKGEEEEADGKTVERERRRKWYSEHYVRLQTWPVCWGVLMWELWAPLGQVAPHIQSPIWSEFPLPASALSLIGR